MKDLKGIVLRFILFFGMLNITLCISAYELKVRMILKGTDKLLTEFKPILGSEDGPPEGCAAAYLRYMRGTRGDTEHKSSY